MSATSPDRPLHMMQARVGGGVAPALNRTRPGDWPTHDAHALVGTALWDALRPLDLLGRGISLSRDDVEQRLDDATRTLYADRPTLLTILFCPEVVLGTLGQVIDLPGGAPADHVWLWMVWIAEASWRMIEQPNLGPDFAPTDPQLLRPIAARLRFLALTEPMRYDLRSPLWTRPELEIGELGRPGSVFGDASAHVFTSRCRQARWTWQRNLDEYQSHPLLSAAGPQQIEQELDQLLFCCPSTAGNGRWRLGRPLALSPTAPAGSQPTPTADDSTAATEAAEHHLLPRFRLTRVARLARIRQQPPRAADRSTRRARLVRRLPALVAAAGTAAVAITAAAAVGLTATGHLPAAVLTAAGCYGLLGIQCVAFGPLWASQWLLRLPAAATVGLFVLMSLPPDWWQRPAGAWPAPAVLVAASYGYLIVEARNHGASRFTAPIRALGVWTMAAVHASLITILGMVVVAPSFVQNGASLAQLWRHGSVPRVLTVLGLAAAWCLTVGVFSQILWDDRPITAMLAHLRWRRGDQP